jgi:hypothetical protein
MGKLGGKPNTPVRWKPLKTSYNPNDLLPDTRAAALMR